MMKYYLMLLAALVLLTSCGPDPSEQVVYYTPIGVQILAYIGVATIIVLLALFIFAFGPFINDRRDEG